MDKASKMGQVSATGSFQAFIEIFLAIYLIAAPLIGAINKLDNNLSAIFWLRTNIKSTLFRW